MLEALIVYSIIMGIRYLILANRPYEKYDDGIFNTLTNLEQRKNSLQVFQNFKRN